jgi:nucleoside-diphosphate-sugar epimerase
MSRRALVTGATGFLGTHLSCALADNGWDVSALVLPLSDVERVDARVRLLQLDGTTACVIDAVKQGAPDVVFHLASVFTSEHLPDQVELLVNANILFGAQLLEAMSLAGVTALVNAGTSWQHFEGAEYDPVCLYAATKQALEDIALFYTNARGLRCQTLRMFDTYGPGDIRPKLFNLLNAASKARRVIDMSPGEQLLDLVHVDDVVTAFQVAAERALASRSGTNEAWAVSSGERMSLRQVVELWQTATQCALEVRWGGRDYRAREVMVPWIGPTLPGWRARTTLDQGLAAMRLSGREMSPESEWRQV